MNWLPVVERVHQFIASSVYKLFSKLAPQYMEEVLKKYKNMRTTRSSNNLNLTFSFLFFPRVACPGNMNSKMYNINLVTKGTLITTIQCYQASGPHLLAVYYIHKTHIIIKKTIKTKNTN